jgi:outer membrane protein insertion porin family
VVKVLIALTLTVGSVAVGGVAGSKPAYAQAVISQVQIVGNRRVEGQTVASYLQLGRGDRYSALRADDSFKALFATGLFSDVKIYMRGSTLVVEVAENPLINRVAFEGNRKIRDEVLASEVESRERAVLTRARVQSDVQRILVLYRRSGRFAAQVEPKIIELPQNRVDLVFEIDEGDKTAVSRINFIGNRAFSDKNLREEITTGESGLLSFLKNDDVYDPDRLAADQEMLRRFYLKNGYADFEIISSVAELDRERNAFFITITVSEGEEYSFGNIDIVSNVRSVDPEVLRSVITTRPGDTYDIEEIDTTLEDLTLELSKLGFAFAQVRPRGDRDPETRQISITYFIEEGPRVYIERINVIGNTRTLDEVVRREFDLVEGDAYNRVLIDRAERRLNALGFFEKVEITREPGSAPDRVIINVLVEEKSTGNLSLGAGFSTSDGIIGDISISERNLLGRGQFVRLALNVSGKRQDVDFSFTEPYFLGRRISAGFDLFAREVDFSDESSFELRRRGGGIRFGFPLSENWSLTTRYQFAREQIRNVTATASLAVKQAAGTVNVSSVGYSLRFDTIDNRNDPRNGLYFNFSQDLAGVGGDVNYLRTTVEGRAYTEVWRGVVALLKVEGGYIEGFGGKNVRILDTFFKGGETIRGFDRSGIGPRDALTGDALGGKVFASATAEVQFPIPIIPDELGFRGAVFADAATLYQTDLITQDGNGDGDLLDAGVDLVLNDSSEVRSAVGVSVLWNSPLGPLRADFAQVINKAGFDDEQFFRFGGGTRF